MKFKVAVVSDVGKVRERNEDAYAFPVACGKGDNSGRGYRHPVTSRTTLGDMLFVVADGVGGSEQGQRASEIAVKATMDAYYTLVTDAKPDERRDFILQKAVEIANREVNAFKDESSTTAATTLVGLLFSNDRIYVVNVGDSRVYKIRGKTIQQLTQDHRLSDELVNEQGMDPEDAAQYQKRITRSVGGRETVAPDIWGSGFEPGDRFVLCTDGLSDQVEDHAIVHVLQRHRNPQKGVAALARLANKNGGKDNVTVMVVDPVARIMPTPLSRHWKTILSLVIMIVIGLLALAYSDKVDNHLSSPIPITVTVAPAGESPIPTPMLTRLMSPAPPLVAGFQNRVYLPMVIKPVLP